MYTATFKSTKSFAPCDRNFSTHIYTFTHVDRQPVFTLATAHPPPLPLFSLSIFPPSPFTLFLSPPSTIHGFFWGGGKTDFFKSVSFTHQSSYCILWLSELWDPTKTSSLTSTRIIQVLIYYELFCCCSQSFSKKIVSSILFLISYNLIIYMRRHFNLESERNSWFDNG